jgi:malate dehydrogenase (oxaloacetate-decarboxylating)(NADP+)
MKLAAVKALANVAKLEVPDIVKKAHNRKDMSFGPEYIIPSPFDRRVLRYVALGVAKAAYEEGISQIKDFNFSEYEQYLKDLASYLDSK